MTRASSYSPELVRESKRWSTRTASASLLLAASAWACTGSDGSGSQGSGGAATNGGTSSATGGSSNSSGGTTQSFGGASSGGSTAGGTSGSLGGSSSSTGGSSAKGGSPAAGGAQSSGGVSSAGAASGGATSAGATGSGGTTGGGGNCPLPSTFKWTSSGPLAEPTNGAVALKDFTHAIYNGQHIVYMTTHDQSNWGSAMMTFADWPNAATATQSKTSFGVAPTLFYFTPKKLWVIAYQWGTHKFSYRTSSDPSKPNGWSAEQSLYDTALPSGGTGPIDQTVICNATKCFLYYAGDNGHVYKSSMPIGNFPAQFAAAEDSGIAGTSQNLFEAVQVYAVQGANKYLMIVEAQGNARYFRAWTATDLEGPWTLLTDTFAAKSNVTFSGTAWTNDISHGDLIRTNPDETFTVDPCKLQLLYQGRDPSKNVDYGLLPYRPGLLTLAN